MLQRQIPRLCILSVTLSSGLLGSGCNSLLNGWLTPIELGSFHRQETLEIRGSLSIQDTPRGVRGATEPTAEDAIPSMEEYRLAPGDVVNVYIMDLQVPNAEFAQQSVVDPRGMLSLRVIGRIDGNNRTAEELENEIRDVLSEKDVVHDAEVLVQFAAQRSNTYTIFGNENLAVRLNRGPGVFPIPKPDFRLLEALSVSGGLSELVSEIYVFRKVERDIAHRAELERAKRESARGDAGDDDVDDAAEIETFPSDGIAMGAGLTAMSFGQTGQAQPKPADSTQNDAKTGEKGQKNDPKTTDPDRDEVQEIIDLMLPGSVAPPEKTGSKPVSPPAQAESQPAESPEMESTEQKTQDPAKQQETARQAIPADLDAATEADAPTKWVFLNGEWIEVGAGGDGDGAENAGDAQPGVDPESDAPAPAIDWEAIAEKHQDVRIIRISAEELRQGSARYNITVRPGDVIRLYSGNIGFYYMTGHVRRPGVYTFRGGTDVTLKNAVAAAAGLDALAWPDRVTVYRRVGDREQMIQVDLDRIYAGLEPDFYLKRDDIVNVGTHPFAPFLIQIRNLTIPQTGGSITYFYRFVRQQTEFRTKDLNARSSPGLFP
jgi:protein involved in polysaccharide export with SLBB domain